MSDSLTGPTCPTGQTEIIMKIYTKTGDKGETGLYGGERVSKDHPRLEAYGSIDELNSFVGWLRSLVLDEDIESLLERIQNVLFDISSQLAIPNKSHIVGQASEKRESEVVFLENVIDAWEKELSPLKNFILPMGTEAAVRAHIVRTIARRVERKIINLRKQIEISDDIIRYLNRLSDCTFVMARVINRRAGVADVKWRGRVKSEE